MESIWLRQLGITMLNEPDEPLSVAYGFMARVFGADNVLIYLYEAEEEHEKAIYIKEGYAVMYPLADERLSRIIGAAGESDEAVHMDGMTALSMHCSQADRFGAVVFLDNIEEISDAHMEAFVSFCEITYAELMGGFFESGNRSVMEVRNLIAGYNRNHNVVDNVSLDICEGELTVIMGKSGCGKSTLLNAVAGILTPYSGQILWNGKDICTMNDKQKTAFRRDELGYIFQNYNLIGELTAGENISVASMLTGDCMPLDDVLEMVGLKDKKNSYPKEMSGGEQQRVSIARALIKNASILLCDEPTGALDTENARIVISMLQKLAKEKNIPIVIVTHNPDYTVLADHYILMSDGRIVKEHYCRFPYMAEKVL